MAVATFSPRRVRRAFIRRARADFAWMVWFHYPYDSFLEGKWLLHGMTEGARVPEVVQRDAERIRAAIPGVDLVVHALHKDPWLEVEFNGERLFVRGWIGDKILV